MRYSALFASLVLSLAALSACKNCPSSEVEAKENASLLQLDSQMTAKNGTLADTVKAVAFIQTAEQYASLIQTCDPDKYVELLLKAAAVAKTVDNAQKALALYTTVADNLPQHPKAPMALFMEGFIYENDLGDTAQARVKYQAFLKKYPNDPDFVDDAQNALKNLGKSPEEMIREFETQNKNRPQ